MTNLVQTQTGDSYTALHLTTYTLTSLHRL